MPHEEMAASSRLNEVQVLLRMAEAFADVANALGRGDTAQAGRLVKDLSGGFETLAEVVAGEV